MKAALKDEIKNTIQFFADTDNEVYGSITGQTKEIAKIQNVDLETSYINKFYNKNSQNSVPVISVNSEPELYKGFKIYKRYTDIFDIVKDGICVGMCAGLNGAKRRIDTNDLNTPAPKD